MRPPSLVLLIGTVLLAGCVSDDRPAACAGPTTSIDLTLVDQTLTPKDPAACLDQEVTLVIDSEVEGVFHIHGYDEAVPATEVTAGEELSLTFTATRSGQFPIELHPADNPQGVGIGVFTVHEP